MVNFRKRHVRYYSNPGFDFLLSDIYFLPDQNLLLELTTSSEIFDKSVIDFVMQVVDLWGSIQYDCGHDS